MPKILASPAYKKDGLLIVTFDQVNPAAPVDPAAPAPSADPLKVGALLVSRFVTPGATDASPTTPTRCCARPRTSSASRAWATPSGDQGEVLRGHRCDGGETTAGD